MSHQNQIEIVPGLAYFQRLSKAERGGNVVSRLLQYQLPGNQQWVIVGYGENTFLHTERIINSDVALSPYCSQRS